MRHTAVYQMHKLVSIKPENMLLLQILLSLWPLELLFMLVFWYLCPRQAKWNKLNPPESHISSSRHTFKLCGWICEMCLGRMCVCVCSASKFQHGGSDWITGPVSPQSICGVMVWRWIFSLAAWSVFLTITHVLYCKCLKYLRQVSTVLRLQSPEKIGFILR